VSLWRRLDRVAGEINPFLMVLVVGLVLLNLTCLVGLVVSNLPMMQISLSSPSSRMSTIGPVTPPSADAAVPNR
jgi:hypothetical protein